MKALSGEKRVNVIKSHKIKASLEPKLPPVKHNPTKNLNGVVKNKAIVEQEPQKKTEPRIKP